MSRLPITIATWDYDRVRPLVDGRVRVEGCDVNYITMPVEECFERAYLPRRVRGGRDRIQPLPDRTVARHRRPMWRCRRSCRACSGTRRSISAPTAASQGPADLKGKRVGVPEYQMSAVMWFRGYLQDEFGIAAKDIELGAGRARESRPPREVPAQPAGGLSADAAPDGQTLSQMLAEGELDAVMSARRPSCFVAGHRKVRRLFPDYRAAEREYFRKTGIFPIMHAVGMRRDILREAPLARRQHLQGVRPGQAAGRRGVRRNHRAQDRPALGQGRVSMRRAR